MTTKFVPFYVSIISRFHGIVAFKDPKTESRAINQLTIADLVSLYVKVSQIEREPVIANDIKRAAGRLSAREPAAMKFHSQDAGHMKSILEMNFYEGTTSRF